MRKRVEAVLIASDEVKMKQHGRVICCMLTVPPENGKEVSETNLNELLVCVGGVLGVEVSQHLVEELDAALDGLQRALLLGRSLGPRLVLETQREE